ncbi:ABC transporter ATP-binding protein [Niastella koreensis]|uniref:Sulfate-transporting ATPase n=2 Tax=Niastella koreensis TaxID=354356 RepID=G8TFW6_NIAKG|nr:ABC transporter ATP-binding protein [Niastella koreensis]AEW00565.1 Sulfate-transporting ATPase [Niastella koreensis GR20-10]OQP52424.1 ABC transporter ATP-binding protein [Niastella koreensis]
MENPVIELTGLSKLYGSLKAVDNLSLTINRGEIYGLLGPNGAGKTTTILMMLGLTEPSAGTVTVCGYNATSNPVAVKKKVGYMPDNMGFYDGMSALDNLVYMGRLNGIPESSVRRRAMEMMDLVGLGQAINKKAAAYSRGMKQRLGLAEVLIKQPEVIIMDEPTLGIDHAGVSAFLSLIRQLSNQQNITVLLSSHHLNQVQQVCDRVGIFVEGKLLANDHIARLSNHLFARDAHVVTITFDDNISNRDEYHAALMSMEGVTRATISEKAIEVSCTRNATPEFVRYFVAKGLNIMGVHQKEYGLEEIYQRYFENNLTEKESNGKPGNLFQRSFFKKIKK